MLFVGYCYNYLVDIRRWIRWLVWLWRSWVLLCRIFVICLDVEKHRVVVFVWRLFNALTLKDVELWVCYCSESLSLWMRSITLIVMDVFSVVFSRLVGLSATQLAYWRLVNFIIEMLWNYCLGLRCKSGSKKWT